MILLNGHSLAVKDVFRPETMQLNLSERSSTASFTVGPDAPVIAVDNWIQDDTAPGKGIIWRVKTIDTQYNTETRTIQLEHVINTLQDRIMFGETKTQDIPGGNRNAVSAENAARYVLSFQNDWVLGDFQYNVSNPYTFNGDSLMDAMETISSSLQDCIWEYDLTRYPFTLHIRQLSAAVGSEMRMSRNIQTLKKTIDRSRMYTRFYPIGKNNLHITGNYITKNEALYGVVSHVETDTSLDTDAKLRAWAQEKLDRHCEPLVTITVSGFDLSEATGEDLDRLVIGRKCQVPLPEFSTVITERITKLSWSDKVSEPERVTVTLANELMDVAKILKQQNASGGRSGRNGAKNDEEDHAWIVDNNEKVELVAEAVAGKDGDGADWSRVASLTVDGQGINARVIKAEGDIVTNTAAIDVNEKAIKAEVTARQTADSTMSGRIDVQANKVGLVVEEKNGQNVIKAASIVASINDAGSYVGIEADHVFITGTTKLSGQLTVQDGSLMVKTALLVSGTTGGNVTINNGAINAKTHQVNSGGSVVFVGGGTGEYYNLNTDTLKGMIKSFEVNGDVLTLTPFYGDPVNFSKATPMINLTGSWSGRTFTVTEQSSGNKYSETPTYETGEGYSLQYDSITVDAFNASHYAYARVLSSSQQGGNVLFGFKIDATGQYSDGQTNGRNGVSIIKGSWSDARCTFTKSAGTASTQAVTIGAATGWQSGVFTYELKDYENDPNGVSIGYTGRTDLGNPSMAKPSIQPGTASLSGRKRAGTSDISKSAIQANGYLFFDVTVRGQVLKFYAGVAE